MAVTEKISTDLLTTYTPARTIGFPKPLLVWGIAFVYAVVLALTLQKLVLPLIPSLHGEHGLLQHDAMRYHASAVQLAERIRTIGWSEWKLWPNGGTGNVGLLAALYALFGPNPAWFVPFAAAAHATGATVLYLIGPLLWPGRTGRLGGLLTATLFVVFPSALLSYGQNFKDPFAIAGFLIIIYVWLRAVASPRVPDHWWRLLTSMAIGVALVWGVRPYLLSVLVGALALSLLIIAALAIVRRRFSSEWKTMALGAACVVLLVAAATALPKDHFLETFDVSSVPQDWVWKSSELIPAPIDKMLEKMSSIRTSFVAHGHLVGASSVIDANHLPDSALGAIVYMPRAAMIGLFAPFPSTWIEKVNLIHIVGAMETMLWYLLAPGVLAALVLRPNPRIVTGMIVCGMIVIVYSYTQPNVGTLYRLRYGPFFFFILCGAIGWARIALKLLAVARRRHLHESLPGARTREITGAPTISDVTASGIVVVLLTTVGYFGFFVRDLMLVKMYGMEGLLDGYCSAVLIPMFLAGVLLMPLADAMMAPLINAGNDGGTGEIATFVRSIMTFAFTVAIVATVGLILVADRVALLFAPNGTIEQLDDMTVMVRWFSLVLALGVWTVVGNGVLNAMHRPLAAATAHLFVPVVAIAFIMMFTETMGLRAAILGMIVGTLANAVFLTYFNYRGNVKLAPDFSGKLCDMSLIRNYALLALAALLVGIAIPMNYAFAARLEPGAVTVWALGGKLVQLFTSLTVVAAAAVLTPHFGRLITFGRSSQLASDAYFMLIVGTWISIVGAIVIVTFSEPFVVTMFQGKEVSESQARYLATIVRLGSLQLPFIVVVTLIIKLAAVSRSSLQVVVAVGLSLAVNLILNLLLVSKYGVYGIAVATVIASATSAIYLIHVLRTQCGLGWARITMFNGSWLTLLGFSAGVFYQSRTAAIAAIVVMLTLLLGQWREWQQVGVSA